MKFKVIKTHDVWINMFTVKCTDCGIPFGVLDFYIQNAELNNRPVFCPAGHVQKEENPRTPIPLDDKPKAPELAENPRTPEPKPEAPPASEPPAKKHAWSPEQRAAAAERMRKMQAAKKTAKLEPPPGE